jgi:hypothetical protein
MYCEIVQRAVLLYLTQDPANDNLSSKNCQALDGLEVLEHLVEPVSYII